MVCYGRTIFGWGTTFEHLDLKVQTNLNIKKIAFKVVQMKFLAMHITNQNYVFIYLQQEMQKICSWNKIFT